MPRLGSIRRAVDEYRASVGSKEQLYTILEDGDFRFTPVMSKDEVGRHKGRWPKGTAERHVDAVFWRKER